MPELYIELYTRAAPMVIVTEAALCACWLYWITRKQL